MKIIKYDYCFGSFSFEAQDHVLRIRVSGIMDDTMVHDYFKEFFIAGKTLCHQKWAILGDVRDLEIGTPSVAEHFKNGTAWSDKNNLTHLALVLGQSSLANLEALKHVKDNHKVTKVETFNSMTKAEDWLAESGFAFDKQH